MIYVRKKQLGTLSNLMALKYTKKEHPSRWKRSNTATQLYMYTKNWVAQLFFWFFSSFFWAWIKNDNRCCSKKFQKGDKKRTIEERRVVLNQDDSMDSYLRADRFFINLPLCYSSFSLFACFSTIARQVKR